MLLEFRTSNYKSFADEMVFSMTKAPRQKGLDYSVQNEEIGGKTYKGLSSAVIYGPNAAGKTNIIGAMDTLRVIVLKGNVRNSDPAVSPNPASNALELIPNRNLRDEPTSFSIKFIEENLVFEYSFVVKLGSFLELDYKRNIVSERLLINEKLVFDRGDDLVVELPPAVKPYLNDGLTGISTAILSIARSGLNEEELFLCNGFKTIFSQKIVSLMTKWFEFKFMVVYRSDALSSARMLSNPKFREVFLPNSLMEASKVFGIASNALGYKVMSENDGEAVLCSFLELDDRKIAIPAEIFESYGTIRFMNEFPLVINALVRGGTLVMDEFDASIHPMALMSVINVFHNDEINKNHAQLIFDTHNPIFLNSKLLRRDEIKFVERDDETGCSIHYSLSDFKTADGTRNREGYMKNYFISKYGAIRDVDFSEILDDVVNGKGVDEDAKS